MNRKARQTVAKQYGFVRLRDIAVGFLLNICFFAFVAFIILTFLKQ
ncbi:hypothetical protein [Peribacillus saganii]|nr:hypothetical protein [Peribacillus saganii]